MTQREVGTTAGPVRGASICTSHVLLNVMQLLSASWSHGALLFFHLPGSAAELSWRRAPLIFCTLVLCSREKHSTLGQKEFLSLQLDETDFQTYETALTLIFQGLVSLPVNYRQR